MSSYCLQQPIGSSNRTDWRATMLNPWPSVVYRIRQWLTRRFGTLWHYFRCRWHCFRLCLHDTGQLIELTWKLLWAVWTETVQNWNKSFTQSNRSYRSGWPKRVWCWKYYLCYYLCKILILQAEICFCWFSYSFLSASVKAVFFVAVFYSDLKPSKS